LNTIGAPEDDHRGRQIIVNQLLVDAPDDQEGEQQEDDQRGQPQTTTGSAQDLGGSAVLH